MTQKDFELNSVQEYRDINGYFSDSIKRHQKGMKFWRYVIGGTVAGAVAFHAFLAVTNAVRVIPGLF